MYVFLWRAVKYFLWLCLFVLLGAFLFWLIRFKWDFKEYVLYLNNVWIEEIVSFEEDEDIIENIEDVPEIVVLEEENSDLLEDDYFLPEASPFWFSGSLEENEDLNDWSNDSSISKEKILDLIKSHEK